MSELIRKSHNVTVLIYHYVCPAKYRRAVIEPKVEEIIKEVCIEIEKRYEIRFLEIGTDKDHVHFLIQAVPKYSPSKIIQMVKSIIAREVFRKAPEVKRQLWGGEFWSDGYYVSTVGQRGSEETIRKYVQEQGKEKEYQQLYGQQLKLFE
ncbi:MAG: IS200/IS605 family transposase [Flexilinea sp.]